MQKDEGYEPNFSENGAILADFGSVAVGIEPSSGRQDPDRVRVGGFKK